MRRKERKGDEKSGEERKGEKAKGCKERSTIISYVIYCFYVRD
jgi:hypothetical protein